MAQFDVNFTGSYIPTRAGLNTTAGARTAAALGAVAEGAANDTRQLNQSAVFYSPTKKTYVVGGNEISSRDEAGLLSATQQADLNQRYDAPQGGDYRPVDTQSFLQFIDKIANPDLGRRFSKNFESATAGMGLLAGAGLRFVGAEEPGQGLMDISARRIQELSPYEMGIEDISGDRSRGVTDWFAGVVGQFGPSIVETVLAAAVGAGAGAAAGGGPNPFTAAGGALAGVFGKTAVKQALLKAAEKKLAGEALDAAEEKLLLEGASLYGAALQKNPGLVGDVIYGNMTAGQFGQQAVRSSAIDALKKGRAQAIGGGAAVASIANSYGMGVSDVYREGLESGSPDRAAALIGGIPYAALDLLPEFLVARRVFGDIGANAAGKLASQQGIRAKAGELLKRGAKGGAIGAGLEGATEAGQEAILLAANPLVDWDSPEGISRLLNSFAAGAAIGGPIGSLANLADNKEPANLLKPSQSLDPDEAQAGPPDEGPVAPTGPTPGPAPSLALPPPTYAEFSEQQPANLLGQQRLLAAPQRQLAAPTPMPPQPVDRSAMLRSLGMRQGEAPQVGQVAPQPSAPIAIPPTGPQQVGMNPLQRMQMQQAMSQQAAMVQAQQPQAVSDVSYIPQLGRAREEAPIPAAVSQAPNPLLAAQQFTRGAVAGAEVSSDVAKFKVGAKAGAKARLRKMTAAQAEKAQEFRQWLETQLAEPQITGIVDAAIQRGDYAQVQQLMQELGFDPNPPKPTKAKTAKPLKTEAKAKSAKAPKGEALKTEKMRAGSSGVNRQDEAPQAASSRKETPQAKARPEAKASERASVRSKQAVEDESSLNDAIGEVDAGSSEALYDVFYYAFPDKDDNIDPKLTARAKDYLSNTGFSSTQRKALDRILKAEGKTLFEEKPKVSETTSSQRSTTLEQLMTFLDTLVRNPEMLRDRVQRMLAIGKAAALYRQAAVVTPGGERAVQSAPFNGKTVGDYFEVDRSGRELKPRLKIELDVEDDTYSLADATDDRTGSFYRMGTNEQVGSIPLGKVRMLVNSILSQLHIKPTVHIYANVAELKARNRSLFDRANKARPAGDFESTQAAGYSFNDQVILFTDHIRTEQQLRFVLAHEAIGHFGLRAVVPGAELNAFLDQVYNNDRRVRAYVDRQVELGMDKREATEEFLADFAAGIETSLLKRLWAMVKSALNKLGLHFDDDMSRLIVAQSRLYVRAGASGGFFNAHTLASTMNLMQEEANNGRFARVMNAQTLGEHFMDMSDLVFNITHPYSDIRDFARDKRIREWTGGTSEGLRRWVGKALETVQTLNNKATRSEGLQLFFDLFQQQNRAARQYLSKYNQMLKETPKLDTRDPDKEKAGKLLAYGALGKNAKMSVDDIDALGSLAEVAEFGGEPTVNEDVFRRLEGMGMMTPEDFRNGFEFPDTTGGVQTFRLAEHGLTEADLDPDGKVWKIYVEQRKAVNRAALDLLLANFGAASYEQRHALDRIFEIKTSKSALTDADRDTIREVIRRYRAITLEGASIEDGHLRIDPMSAEKADKFLQWVTRAFDNDAVMRSWLGQAVEDDVNKVPENFFKDHKDLGKRLQSLYEKGYTDRNRYSIQQQVRNLGMLSRQVQDAERLAKRTILSGYVPFKRRGRMQVRLAAYNEKGERVKLADHIRGVTPYFRDDNDVVLNQYVKELSDTFGDEFYELEDVDGNKQRVQLKPEKSEARQGPDFTGMVNMNEFVYMLQKFGINITPASREAIVKQLTDSNDRARSNLMRAGTPGWDADVIRSVAEHLEAMAHTAAKRIYRPQIDDTMTRDAFWRGNRQKLDELKRRYDTETDLQKKARAKREYERYAYMYRYMASDTRPVEINGKEYKTLGAGERYRSDAKELLQWYTDQTNIGDYENPIVDSELGSRLKTAVVFAQLGGTIATAAVNVVSLLTHTIPNAAYYNPQFGSGGGYGWGKSARQVWSAISDVKNFKLGDIDTLHSIKDTKTWDRYNLTEDELDFLIDQTESGPLQAVLPDALLGTARGKITDPRWQKAGQIWMGAFSYTEKLNRRVTALAVYRLERERASAELGKGLDDPAVIKSATNAALRAVTDTQGEYAAFNRPKLARGNLLSYVFMYKVFPIITVQLLRRLPLKGKLTMLALLLLMSGLKGLPFADDIMDLLDTLLQKLGIKIGSVEAELYELFDSTIPGSGNIFMRGGLDQWTGATISTRLGMGDLVPLTGALKAGADPWREAQNFLGPMAGGLFGFTNSVGAFASMGVDLAGGRPSSTNLIEIARQSPIALARALGDAWVYADNGAVVNSQGRVVTSDAGPLILLWRALGFYPAAATRSNDLVRVSKAARDYQLEVSKAFKDAYVKAALSGDKQAMKDITEQVEQWNDDAEGTGLEIANFGESVRRAVKEAKQPAGARFLKTTPLSMRERTAEWMRLYAVEE